MGDYLAGVAVSVVKFLSHLHYFSYNVESTRCALRDEKTETEQSGKSSIIFLSLTWNNSPGIVKCRSCEDSKIPL